MTAGSRTIPDEVDAVLFDLDDTLVATEQAWSSAADRLWREAGAGSAGAAVSGGTLHDITAEFSRHFPDADPVSTEDRLRELLSEELGDRIRSLPGVEELLERLAGRVPMAVASNSPSAIVQRVIRERGWQGRFAATLGAEDVVAPKPAPDLYLAAAARCGADIRRCVVFEDSAIGTAAAVAAGAFVVTVGAEARGSGHAEIVSFTDPLLTRWQPCPAR